MEERGGARRVEHWKGEERRVETPGSLTAMHHQRKENTKASSAARFFCSHCIPHPPTDHLNILSAGERTYRPQGQRLRIFGCLLLSFFNVESVRECELMGLRHESAGVWWRWGREVGYEV